MNSSPNLVARVAPPMHWDFEPTATTISESGIEWFLLSLRERKEVRGKGTLACPTRANAPSASPSSWWNHEPPASHSAQRGQMVLLSLRERKEVRGKGTLACPTHANAPSASRCSSRRHRPAAIPHPCNLRNPWFCPVVRSRFSVRLSFRCETRVTSNLTARTLSLPAATACFVIFNFRFP